MEEELLYFRDLTYNNKTEEYLSVSHHEGDDFVTLHLEYAEVDLTVDQVDTLILSLEEAKKNLCFR